ncbi:hypothetical protein ACFX2J_028401 [Malus domestica]
MQRRCGRFTGGPRFQRQRDFGGSGGSGAPLCCRCNNLHFGSVREAAMNVLLVDRWVIGLPNAFGVSRDPISFHSHHLHRRSKLQDLMVTLRLDDEVPTTIRETPLPTPQVNNSTIRILNIKVGILSIRDDLCLISHIQSVDLSGTK